MPALDDTPVCSLSLQDGLDHLPALSPGQGRPEGLEGLTAVHRSQLDRIRTGAKIPILSTVGGVATVAPLFFYNREIPDSLVERNYMPKTQYKLKEAKAPIRKLGTLLDAELEMSKEEGYDVKFLLDVRNELETGWRIGKVEEVDTFAVCFNIDGKSVWVGKAFVAMIEIQDPLAEEDNFSRKV